MFWEAMLQFLCDKQCYVYVVIILKKKKNKKEISRNAMQWNGALWLANVKS